jgi:Winged helix DNA-binding domain
MRSIKAAGCREGKPLYGPAMAEPRLLDSRALHRALLARQLLLERSRVALPRALELLGGIQAQYAPSMYVGLWSRLDGFRREDLTGALERREVVQGTLIRSTIHLVSRADYWPIAIAVRRARRAHWLAATRERVMERDQEAAAARLRDRLADGPVTRREMDALIGRDAASGVGLWLDMVRVPPSGTWERRSANTYAAAEDWLGPEPTLEASEAMAHLCRRYLGGFGPASPRDVASFTGIPPRDVNAVLDGMELRRFRDEAGGELLDLPRMPLPDPSSPAPVRFLPTWDATLLVHARRTQILPEEHRSRVFHTKTPHSVATFLVDGRVAGTWRYERGAVTVSPFGSLTATRRREVDAEAERVAAFHA